MFWRGLTTAPPVISSNWTGVIFGAVVSALKELNTLRQSDWKLKWRELGWSVLIGIVAWMALAVINGVHLAYSDQAKLTTENQSLRVENARLKRHLKAEADVRSALRKAIQTRLSVFIDEGRGLREEWRKKLLSQPKEAQRKSATAVESWHVRVESYLKSLPNSNVYVSRFNVPQPGIGDFPIGINYDVDDQWNLLLNSLIRLNEFISDPNLGNP
jgi:hypothetical protein